MVSADRSLSAATGTWRRLWERWAGRPNSARPFRSRSPPASGCGRPRRRSPRRPKNRTVMGIPCGVGLLAQHGFEDGGWGFSVAQTAGTRGDLLQSMITRSPNLIAGWSVRLRVRLRATSACRRNSPPRGGERGVRVGRADHAELVRVDASFCLELEAVWRAVRAYSPGSISGFSPRSG